MPCYDCFGTFSRHSERWRLFGPDSIPVATVIMVVHHMNTTATTNLYRASVTMKARRLSLPKRLQKKANRGFRDGIRTEETPALGMSANHSKAVVTRYGN